MKLDRCLILENKISKIEIKGIKPNYKIRISQESRKKENKKNRQRIYYARNSRNSKKSYF